LSALHFLNFEGRHILGHNCTLRETGITHIGVGSITSLVAKDEMVFNFFFFQSYQRMVKLTASQLGRGGRCKGRWILEQDAIRKRAQNQWPVYCTRVVKCPILRHFSFGWSVWNESR